MLGTTSHANSATQLTNPANSALGALDIAISSLQEGLEELEKRIGTGLSPPHPEKVQKSDQAGSPIPIVDSIMQQTSRVQRLVDQCGDLIERVGI